MGEATEAQPQLERIDPRIQVCERGVGYMHEAKLRAPVVLAAQEMQTQRAARGEIYVRGAGGHVNVCEERATAEFEIRNDLTRLPEIPFQSEGIQAKTIRRTTVLDHQKNRDDIHRVFELAAQESRANWWRQNPTVTHTHVPDAAVGGAAIQSVAATCPDLQIMSAILRASLSL